MANPKVSIVIPVYNREHLVRRAIESAIGQTYPDIEVVVVDNHSTDGTYHVIQEYARHDWRVRCLRNDRNVGPVKNWIKCIEYSEGNYIKILYSDDWLEPDAIEGLIWPFLEHQDIGFTFSAVDIHRGQEVETAYQLSGDQRISSVEFLKGLIGQGWFPRSPSSALFRRRDVLGSFPEHVPNNFGLDCDQYGAGNDVMLFLTTCERYPYVYGISRRLLHFLAHESSFSVSVSESSPKTFGICYDSAFSYFIATTSLDTTTKHVLNTVLLKRILRDRQLGWVASRVRYYMKIALQGYRHLNYREASRLLALMLVEIMPKHARRVSRALKRKLMKPMCTERRQAG